MCAHQGVSGGVCPSRGVYTNVDGVAWVALRVAGSEGGDGVATMPHMPTCSLMTLIVFSFFVTTSTPSHSLQPPSSHHGVHG